MTTPKVRTAGEWAGQALGTRTVSWDERDAILYALAIRATADELDLVFEERLRVLPTFALTLAQWAPDALGSQNAFDVRTAVHGSQRLRVLAPLPRVGTLELRARVGDVWDKGSAAVFDVVVESEAFVATWALFAPGCGGFGGQRGPSGPRRPDGAPGLTTEVVTAANQAALYRLLGDRHHMHVDPDAARAAGQPRPFLHGLCTLAASTLSLARALGAHPADLTELDGRFSAPVFPGDRLQVAAWADGSTTAFEVMAGERPVLSGGRLRFG
jgi:acyl dehydratase